MPKSYEEINEKIRKGQVVVVTAEEMIDIVAEQGAKEAAKKVDVVTTGTFGAMCSSGAFLNIGHAKPRIKLGGGHATLNGVPAYAGIAAADLFIGAAATPDDDPRNQNHPGSFRYGGGHVIEDLVAGKDVRLQATTYGTDCYPRKKLDTWINIRDLNEAILYNPRNGYQNYNVGINATDHTIYTYMGILKPNMANATFSSAGQLSPLLNDPEYRTIGIGTRIFLGGGVGYVSWHGTQHSPNTPRTDNGVPRGGAGTLAVTGDMKQMSDRFLRGVSFLGYGSTMFVGIGIPIPILDEEMARYTAVRDEDILAQVIDYGGDYPELISRSLAEVSYAQLRSGKIEVQGKEVPTAPLSSYARAREIAGTLKEWIAAGKFEITRPVQALPGSESGYGSHALRERPVGEDK